MKHIMRQLIGGISSLAVALGPILSTPALGEGIVGSGPRGPAVLTSGNNTPLVMIERPNAAGVSHNTYERFDIDGRGAILNNIDSNYGRTQLGGYVQGNSNLRDGAARIIINEVIAPNPSDLQGYLEVGGVRADVVLANPYGITCDGCGFINTDRATLTTGLPQFGPAGQLRAIDVSRGHVVIGERGLDATGVSQFDLLSRSVSFAGAIHGRNVRVVAGRNNVIYATGEVEVRGDDGGEAPAIAIDSTVLGGMYADRITIMSTERGAGVRAPDTMAANAGEMHITADGRLVMGQASAQRVTVRSNNSDIEIRERIYAAEQAELTAARDLVLAANAELVSESALSVRSGRDMVLGAGAVAGSRQAGVDAQQGGALRLGAGAGVVATQDLGLRAGSLALGADATISSEQTIAATVSGNATLAPGAVLVAGGDLSLVAGRIALDETALIASAATAEIAAGQLDLNGGTLQAAGDMTLDAGRIGITGGGIRTDRTLSVTAGTLSGGDHLLAAGQQLTVDASRIDLADGSIIGGGDVMLAAGQITLGGLTGSQSGNLMVTARTGDLSAAGGLSASGDIVLTSAVGMELGHV